MALKDGVSSVSVKFPGVLIVLWRPSTFLRTSAKEDPLTSPSSVPGAGSFKVPFFKFAQLVLHFFIVSFAD